MKQRQQTMKKSTSAIARKLLRQQLQGQGFDELELIETRRIGMLPKDFSVYRRGSIHVTTMMYSKHGLVHVYMRAGERLREENDYSALDTLDGRILEATSLKPTESANFEFVVGDLLPDMPAEIDGSASVGLGWHLAYLSPDISNAGSKLAEMLALLINAVVSRMPLMEWAHAQPED